MLHNNNNTVNVILSASVSLAVSFSFSPSSSNGPLSHFVVSLCIQSTIRQSNPAAVLTESKWYFGYKI